jgi:CRISPR-associated protein Cst1
MMRYTGNPYVDAGVAVLELRLHKPCDQFTDEDLEGQGTQIKGEYRKKIWRSYLTVHLPNCAWTQKDPSSAKNREYIRRALESYKPEFPELGRACLFCGRPAKIMADRRYVPLLTGETVMTSGAGGEPGSPVCGYCVFAVHFYPFATLKVEGRPLFWWAPDPRWTRRLTALFYTEVQRMLVASTDEFPKLRWPASRLLQAARQALNELLSLPSAERPPLSDILGVHATNFGTAPSFDELRIPVGLLEFWSEAGAFELYRRIEQEAWDSGQRKTKRARGNGQKKATEDGYGVGHAADATGRNRLFEALGQAFRANDYRQSAKQVALQFFMRWTGRSVAPNTTALAEIFLEKVADMEKERLEAIREISDTIAEHLILGAGDRRVAWQLFQRRLKLGDLMWRLSQIQRKLSDLGHPLEWGKVLLALGLANEDDRTSSDYWLVHELMLIRLYERLAKSDVLSELPEPEEPQVSEPTKSMEE